MSRWVVHLFSLVSLFLFRKLKSAGRQLIADRTLLVAARTGRVRILSRLNVKLDLTSRVVFAPSGFAADKRLVFLQRVRDSLDWHSEVPLRRPQTPPFPRRFQPRIVRMTCLIARRLVERRVRFIQLFPGGVHMPANYSDIRNSGVCFRRSGGCDNSGD